MCFINRKISASVLGETFVEKTTRTFTAYAPNVVLPIPGAM
jgi:hypothetical protein